MAPAPVQSPGSVFTPMSNASSETAEQGDAQADGAKALVRDHFAAINDRDRAAVADLHADDVVVHSGGRELNGIEAVIADWWAQLEALPDLEDRVEMLIAEGDRVAVRYTTTGTHEGAFLGIEPTGETVTITSMAVARVADGQIVEWWNHPDRFGLFEQLGLVDDPTE